VTACLRTFDDIARVTARRRAASPVRALCERDLRELPEPRWELQGWTCRGAERFW
jgi:hypothetical protein